MWLIIIVLVYFIANVLISWLTLKFEKTLEFLADLYAAKRFGKLNMINGLMTVVKSTEITEYLYKMILQQLKKDKHLSHLDYDQIVHIVMNKFPDKVMSKPMLNKFLQETFNSEEITNLKRNPDSIDLKEKNKFINDSYRLYRNKKNYKVIDWNLFDFNKKDMKIDEVEYPYLIKSLIEHPGEQMYDLLYDNVQSTRWKSHPTVSERILFLEKNLPGH